MSNDITALIAKLREYIPNGDGHDSEFAHTLQSAIEALSSRPECSHVYHAIPDQPGSATSASHAERMKCGHLPSPYAPPAAAEGVPADSVALAACRAVVEWCDKNPPAGSALWCVNLCRFAIAKAPAFSPVAASEPSLAMVGAQVVAVPATSLKEAFDRWQDERIGRAALVKAQQKESIDPLELFGAGYRYAFLSTPPVDANKGGVPEGWAVREGISAGTYTLVHPSGIKFTFGHDGSMYAGAVADFLKAMLSAAPSAPVAADESLKEVIGAGTRLSNIAYNFAQNPGHALTSEDVSIFDRERKRWDRAVSALAPRKADGKEAQG